MAKPKRVKTMQPPPVFEAVYSDGARVRASFQTPQGKPFDIAHGRTVANLFRASDLFRRDHKAAHCDGLVEGRNEIGRIEERIDALKEESRQEYRKDPPDYARIEAIGAERESLDAALIAAKRCLLDSQDEYFRASAAFVRDFNEPMLEAFIHHPSVGTIPATVKKATTPKKAGPAEVLKLIRSTLEVAPNSDVAVRAIRELLAA